MHHQILPIPCKPYTLNWSPERLIDSHYENNYGTVLRAHPPAARPADRRDSRVWRT